MQGPIITVVETLETRRFMDASAALADGVLTITGTEGKDTIVVALHADDDTRLDVTVNRQTSMFNADEVDAIVINAGSGNDKVMVNEKNGDITAPLTVDGGAGSDTIATGSGDDVIDGGDGKDKISGGDGNDEIDSGAGNDSVSGDTGDDTITGDDGKDTINGGAGNDDLDGGAGKDTVKTGTGDDLVATDSSNLKEVKDRGGNDRMYHVADFTDLPDQIQQLHEQKVPGSSVIKVEIVDGIVTMRYRFGTDPKVYETVVDASGENLELISRGLSDQELRNSAVTLFEAKLPGAAILDVVQKDQGYYDVRYRDADGTVQTITTHNVIWGQADVERDTDNNGLDDGNNNQPGLIDDPDQHGGGDQNGGGGDQGGGGDSAGGNGDRTEPNTRQA